jgi:phosphohistidine phosphatase
VRKGGVWWLRQRERAGAAETVLLTVQSPELL